MTTLDVMLTRQSCRAYTDEQITEEQLNNLLIAANAAPIGMKMYEDMALTVIQDKAFLNKLEPEILKILPKRPHPLYNAPTCILVSVKKQEGLFATMHLLSAACIIENILIEATEMGLGSTFLLGAGAATATSEELKTTAKVPEGFIPVAMAAVGYSAEPIVKKEPVTNIFQTERI